MAIASFATRAAGGEGDDGSASLEETPVGDDVQDEGEDGECHCGPRGYAHETDCFFFHGGDDVDE